MSHRGMAERTVVLLKQSILFSFLCLHFGCVCSLTGDRIPVRWRNGRTPGFKFLPKGLGSVRQRNVSTKNSEKNSLENYFSTFELVPPISIPSSGKACRINLMKNHSFATLHPPYTTNYKPPSNCGKKWSKIILSLRVQVNGHQYDRRIIVAFGGLEVLRSTTSLPFEPGVKWSIDVDISKYSSYLSKSRLFTVILENVVDANYTGIYYGSANVTFYSGKPASGRPHLTVPISPDPTGFNPYVLTHRTLSASKTLSNLPMNAYRAEIELYLSHHGSDEFYWGNPPNSYINALDKSQRDFFVGDGVFREIQVYIDGKLAGSVWNKLLFYSGAINPLLWVPVVAIGTFITPTYSINIDPFLGILTDGKNHKITLAMNKVPEGGTWYISGGLHLWLDPKLKRTYGMLTKHQVKPTISPTETVKFLPNRPDAEVVTQASREDVISGYLYSSLGNITTTIRRKYNLYNINQILNNISTLNTFNLVNVEYTTVQKNSKGVIVYSGFEKYSFPLSFFVDYIVYQDGSNSIDATYSHAFYLNTTAVYGNRQKVVTLLKNEQKGSGYSLQGNDFYVARNSLNQTLFDENFDYTYNNPKPKNTTLLKDCFSGSLVVKDFEFVSSESSKVCQ